MSESQELYAAIGRFIIEFSRLQHMADWMTIQATYTENANPPPRAKRMWALVANKTASGSLASFFTLLKDSRSGQQRDGDAELLRSVQKEAERIVKERNRISHDVWATGHPNRPLDEGVDAELLRYGANLNDEHLPARVRPITVQEINELAADANRLRRVIALLALYMIFDLDEPFSTHVVLDAGSGNARPKHGAG